MSTDSVDFSDWAAFEGFLNEFRDESDRASAILGCAVLDDILSRFIRSFLVDAKDVAKLFTESGPLGTFRTRIDLAFGLGLISRDSQRDLHLIRKIRNDFAHRPHGWSFTTSQITDRCKELGLIAKLQKENFKLLKGDTPRNRYIAAVGIYVLTFDARSRLVDRLPERVED